MALSANTVFEVEYAGADSNGGGFVTGSGGTDYSQQSAAQGSGTNLTVDSSSNTKVNPDGYTVVAGDVGNLIQITSTGSGSAFTTGVYQITAASTGTSSTQRWTLDRSPAATSSSGATWSLGGAFATPGMAASVMAVSSQTCYVKYNSSAYTMSTATPGAGGPISLANSVNCKMLGYDQTRGDHTGNRPQISWGSVSAPGATTYLVLLGTSAFQLVDNLLANGNSVAKVSGFGLQSSRHIVSNCVAENCNGAGEYGFNVSTGGGSVVASQASGCTTGFFANTTGVSFTACDAYSCTTGFTSAVSASDPFAAVRSMARSCTTGFLAGASATVFERCLADSCSTAGFDNNTNSVSVRYLDCIASNQSGGGAIGFTVGSSIATLMNCAVYNNTSNITGTPFYNVNEVTLTQQPYISAGSDYRPNTTTGGGASLRAAGIGVFGQSVNTDIGAVQHSDPSAGPTGIVMMVRGANILAG